MKTKSSKYKLLNIRGSLTTTVINVELKATNDQKYLGLMKTPSLNYNDNCNRNVPKTARAFFQLKRNIPSVCSWINELHFFIGYKVPIVTYCFQARLPIKINFVKFEKFQIMAKKWIFSSINDYKERLTKLSTLTLSLFVGMPPFFHYPTILNSKYDIPVNFENSHDDKIKQLSSVREHQVLQYRLLISDDNFFHQTKLLYTIIIKSLNKYGNEWNKNHISEVYWK